MSELGIYTLKELEKEMGISYRTLLKYIKEGRLKAVRVGRSWRVSEENLKAFLNGES